MDDTLFSSHIRGELCDQYREPRPRDPDCELGKGELCDQYREPYSA